MKKIVYLFTAGFLLILTTFPVDAQETQKNPFDLSMDVMSRYVWRGTDFGGSPSMQPGFSYTKSGFMVGTWGAYTMNSAVAQELDLYLSYTFLDDMISIGFTDYFFPNELAGNDHYFDYRENHTGHVFEATLAFAGTEKIPLGVLVATNVYGADAKRLNEDGSVAGNQFSTYAELSYSFPFIDLFAGMNLTKPNADLGESGFYGDYLGFVNIGCTVNKDIKITDSFSLPLSVSLITNPQTEKFFLVAGLSF
ncbi:MAG: TorF family putative porin [Bacteroidales bacterium]